jgi:UDP-glucose 4-epimerase
MLGRSVVGALVARGVPVLAATRGDVAWLPRGCQPIRLDVREPEIVTEAVSRSHVVVHLAAVVGNAACERDLRTAVAVNVDGTLNVLEAVRVHRKPMLFASVANVEDWTPYAITKATAERFCRMFHRDCGTAVLPVRIYNAYGPGQSAESGKLVAVNIRRGLRGEPLVCHGDGEQVEDFVFVDDVGRTLAETAIAMALEPRDRFEPVELGTGEGTSIRQVLERIRVLTGGRSKIAIEPPRVGSAARRLVANGERIGPSSGWVPLDEGVARTVEATRVLLDASGTR